LSDRRDWRRKDREKKVFFFWKVREIIERLISLGVYMLWTKRNTLYHNAFSIGIINLHLCLVNTFGVAFVRGVISFVLGGGKRVI